MYLSTSVNKSFTETVAEARPVSNLAAVTLLVTSIAAVHFGAESVLKDAPGLLAITTGAMIGFEWLQWTSLGRITRLDDARQHARANVLKAQCAGIACLQVLLYTVAVVAYAGKTGANWGEGWPLAGSIAIASLYAFLNFVAKWTSCETVDAPAASRATGSGPKGGTSIDDAIFGKLESATPAPSKSSNVTQLQDRANRESERRAVQALLDDAGRNTLRDGHGRFAKTAAG